MKDSCKVFDEQIKKELLACNGSVFLGKLATRQENKKDEAIYLVPRSEAIAISIDPLSNEPKVLIELREKLYGTNTYLALDTDQMSFVINDLTYFSKSSHEKIDHWKKTLTNRFIVFKADIDIDENDVTLKIKMQSFEPANEAMFAKKYIAVPKVHQSEEVLAYALYHEKPIELTGYPHFNVDPKYLICDESLYYKFLRWERSNEHNREWFTRQEETSFYKAELTPALSSIQHEIIEASDDLMFLSKEGELELESRLVELGEPLPEVSTIPKQVISPTFVKEKAQVSYPPTTVKAEHVFLDELRGLTVSENLLYDQKDLVNFHISLKTSPLNIVAGMSGTGKTRLAKAYARTLGLTEEKGDLLFLPVSPSFLEPNDVLGYLNPSSGYFVPSETGLVDLLVRARNNPNAMHMVIFDEMNLSQVEHWFAPFLSILEKPEQDRLLHLYSENATCYNADRYPPSVNIGGNILFIGTINLDETTKDLSDRLLDRVNLVTLKKSTFMHFSTLDLEDATYQGIAFTYNDFQSWKNDDLPTKAFKATELQFFDELHGLIFKYDTQKGVSFRFLNRLGCYIKNIPLDETGKLLINQEQAIDISIKQSLLTKIKGSKQQIGNLIGEATSPESEVMGSELLEFLNNEGMELNDFRRTKAEIKRKALELTLYGYTN